MKNLPLCLLEAAVVVAMALLIWTNLALRRENDGLRHALELSRRAASSRVFHPGERFEYAGLVAPGGGVLQQGQMAAERQLVLIVDPSCGTCEEETRELRARRHDGSMPPMIVSTGTAADTAAFAQRLDVTGITFRLSESVAPEVRVKYSRTPQVFVAARGTVMTVCASVAGCDPAAGGTSAKK